MESDLEGLSLTKNVINNLNIKGIYQLRDFTKISDVELLKTPGVGKKTYKAIIKKLAENELCLAGKLISECTIDEYENKGVEIEYSDWINLIRRNSIKRKDIPEHLIDESIELELIKRNPLNILKANPNNINRECWISAVRYNKSLLSKVPSKYYTESFLIDLVNTSPYIIEHIPLSDQTDELWISILSKHPSLIEYLPKKMAKFDILKLVPYHELFNIPDNYFNNSISYELINLSLDYLEVIPPQYITEELYIKYAKKDSSILNFIPYSFQGKKYKQTEFAASCKSIFMASCEKHNSNTSLIEAPEQIVNYSNRVSLKKEEVLKIVESFPLSIAFIQEEELTSEVVDLAVSLNGLSIAFVPRKYLTLEVCEKAFNNNDISLLMCPKRKQLALKRTLREKYSVNRD